MNDRPRDDLGIAIKKPRLAAIAATQTVYITLLVIGLARCAMPDESRLGSVNGIVTAAELKTVKLYGAGGIAGLDAFQSGFFISAEGHILTVWSSVLDVDKILAIGSDGNRYEATVVGIDPGLEIAVLKTDVPPTHFFDPNGAVVAHVGERVFAVSNLFGIAAGSEMSSVQKGNIIAITELSARRGSLDSIYQGRVYVIDAMTNNPGAAGGALIDAQGRLIGMLGKELRDKSINIWLNYAVAIADVQDSVSRILEGKSIVNSQDNRVPADRPATLSQLGIVLVPDLLAKTPAYVDLVQSGSIAERAGLADDDLILLLNSTRVVSQQTLREELTYIDRSEDILLIVQRGSELKEILLSD